MRTATFSRYLFYDIRYELAPSNIAIKERQSESRRGLHENTLSGNIITSWDRVVILLYRLTRKPKSHKLPFHCLLDRTPPTNSNRSRSSSSNSNSSSSSSNLENPLLASQNQSEAASFFYYYFPLFFFFSIQLPN